MQVTDISQTSFDRTFTEPLTNALERSQVASHGSHAARRAACLEAVKVIG
jgi:hypothetical protein